MNTKPKIKLYDCIFAHAHTMSNGHQNIKSPFFDWYRGDEHTDIAIYTDFNLAGVSEYSKCHKLNIALLMESPSVFPAPYNEIVEHENKFDYIFTFSDRLLKRVPKYIPYQLGGTWIPQKDWAVYHKTKMVSMIASEKANTDGQRLRHEMSKKYSDKIDVFGKINNKPIKDKLQGLKEYRYSIVTENCIHDTYFTEKLIDCFLTGTIPIYYGSPSVAQHFMGESIGHFVDMDDLDKIFSTLTVGNYANRFNGVCKNFIYAKQYAMPENIIYEALKERGVL